MAQTWPGWMDDGTEEQTVCCRISAARHTAWQLQNGAFMQPSDWSHCVSVVDNILLSRHSTLLGLLEREHELHQILYLKN